MLKLLIPFTVALAASGFYFYRKHQKELAIEWEHAVETDAE